MTAPLAADSTLTGGVLVAVIALSVVGLALVVAAIIDITRRPAVLGGQKWVWIVVVLLFNLVGPIVYFAIGRVSAPVTDDGDGPQGAARDRTAAAADLLYGPSAGSLREDGTPPPPPPPA